MAHEPKTALPIQLDSHTGTDLLTLLLPPARYQSCPPPQPPPVGFHLASKKLFRARDI